MNNDKLCIRNWQTFNYRVRFCDNQFDAVGINGSSNKMEMEISLFEESFDKC